MIPPGNEPSENVGRETLHRLQRERERERERDRRVQEALEALNVSKTSTFEKLQTGLFVLLGTVSVGGLVSSAFADSKSANVSSGTIHIFEIIGIFLILIAVAAAIPWFITRRTYMKNQNVSFAQRLQRERELHAQAMEKLKQASELQTLMQLNQDQIDTYHRIVTGQADKSFRSSRIAMGLGMFLLVCAAVGGAWVPLEQVRWFIGALAALSTLLSGYLNRTYLTLYKESIAQLNRYFDQPVLNGYHLAAERIASKLSEDHQDEVRKQIITEILANGPRRLETAPPKETKPKPKKRTSRNQTSSVNGTPQA